ncbi:MAG: class I SAM-dependent methyltransferase [Candidatus Latescibacteria bacterium]|jgi:SAM-dependent methyltransferase|nr:class I SAM-dependent methyltransferase [Candidatus Latescibacterota bacterium]
MRRDKQAAEEVFGRRAEFYTTSESHTDPQVLARVVELSQAQADWCALDVGTGTGHTAFALAPSVASVIGVDLTPEMLQEARKLQAEQSCANVSFEIADVHQMPYPDGAFDLTTCRRAAHHFTDIVRAVGEMHRTLRDGGRLVVDDRSIPEDDFVDRCMNALDLLHDESHVREYRPSEFESMLGDAGFRVEAVEPYVKHRPLSSLTQDVAEENVAKIMEILDGLDETQRKAMNVEEVDGEIHTNHWFVMVAATKS